MVDRDQDWDFHLRTLSNSARDSNSGNDPASDPNILQSVSFVLDFCLVPQKIMGDTVRVSVICSFTCLKVSFVVYFELFLTRLCINSFLQVKRLYELCKAENSEDLVARVYPQFNKIFQRSVSSLSQSGTSNGLLLLVCFLIYWIYFHKSLNWRMIDFFFFFFFFFCLGFFLMVLGNFFHPLKL